MLIVVLVVLVSLEVAGAGDDLSMTVVLLSVLFSPGGLVTVVSFFSHAAIMTSPSSMQMYFIISSYS